MIDGHSRTGVKGVYTAGDITAIPLKQIIVAMGDGVKAGLSVFEEYARGVLAALPRQEETTGRIEACK